jgi:hypothetical protein
MSFLDLNDDNEFSWVSLDPPIIENIENHTFFVSGFVVPDETKGVITHVRRVEQRPMLTETMGTYLLQAFDAEGNVIGSTLFNLFQNKLDCESFEISSDQSFFTQLTIPTNAGLQKLEISKDGENWGGFIISENPPTVSFIAPEPNESLSSIEHVGWEGSDQDDENLTYTLLYSPNGIENWQPLGITNNLEMEVNVSNLPSGESPAFRIQASDGFHVATDDRPIHVDFPLGIKYYGPIDSLKGGEGIFVQFTNPVVPGSLVDSLFQLHRLDSQDPIQMMITYDYDSQTALLQPFQSLIEGSTYSVRVGSQALDMEKVDLNQEVSTSKKRQKKKKKKGKGFLKNLSDKLDDLLSTKEEAEKIPEESPIDSDRPKEEINPEAYHIQDIYGNVLDSVIEWRFVVVGSDEQ